MVPSSNVDGAREVDGDAADCQDLADGIQRIDGSVDLERESDSSSSSFDPDLLGIDHAAPCRSLDADARAQRDRTDAVRKRGRRRVDGHTVDAEALRRLEGRDASFDAWPLRRPRSTSGPKTPSVARQTPPDGAVSRRTRTVWPDHDVHRIGSRHLREVDLERADAERASRGVDAVDLAAHHVGRRARPQFDACGGIRARGAVRAARRPRRPCRPAGSTGPRASRPRRLSPA